MKESLLTTAHRWFRQRLGRGLVVTLGAIAVCVGVSAAALGAGFGASGAADSSAAAPATGTLRVATSQTPSSLDPCQSKAGYDLPYLTLLYAPVIDSIPSTGKLIPGLATSWGFSGKKKLTFKLTLKRGVKFQDGAPVNAAAVVKSIKRCDALGINTVPSLKSIRATGPYSVRIDLKAPNAGLPGLLAARVGMIVSPKAVAKYGKNLISHPVGAGPYQLTSYAPGNTVDFKRFAGYKASGEPAAKFAKIHVQLITNPTALTNALNTGNVDYSFGVDPTNLGVLAHNPNLEVSTNKHAIAFTFVGINKSLPPMQNRLLRLAMEYAVDRKAMAVAASNGVFSTPAWAPYPKGNPYYDKTMDNAWPYNPTKAKQLLTQAGYPNGVDLTGIAITDPPFGPDATILAAQLAKVGIRVTFTQEAGAQAISDFSEHNAAMLFSIGWDSTLTPYQTYNGMFDSQSFFVAGHVGTPGVDALINKLNADYTHAAVMRDERKIDAIFKNDPPYIPLYDNPFADVYSKKLHGDAQASSLTGEPDMNYLSLAH